jgi:Zn-dependent protease
LQSLDIPFILASFAVFVVSLSFHEAAHAWTASRLGDPTAKMLGRLTLNPLAHIDWIGTVLFPLLGAIAHLPIIGWAKPVPVSVRNLRHPRRDFALVALAGPVSNLILAAIAAAIFAVVVRSGGPDGVAVNVLVLAVVINVLLAVFNLIPIPPLDGSNIAIGLLPASLAVPYARIRPYGFLLLYGLLISGILMQLIMPVERVLLSWLL